MSILMPTEILESYMEHPWTIFLMGVSQKRFHTLGIYGINATTLVSDKEPEYNDLFTCIAQCQNGCTTPSHLHKRLGK